MRFVVDCMLGKLAKWLRMLGFDTLYIPDADDDELVRIAVREDRVLLTRDARLCGRRMVRKRAVFIDWGTTSQQVKQTMNELGLRQSDFRLFTRCTICNEPIVPIEREAVRSRVPPYVFKTQSAYGYCASCDKIYWRGTHVERVLAALDAQSGARNKQQDE